MERKITFIAEDKKRESKDIKDKTNGLTPQQQQQEAQPYIPQENPGK